MGVRAVNRGPEDSRAGGPEGRWVRGLDRGVGGKSRAGGLEGRIARVHRGRAGTQKIGGRGGATPLPWFALRRTEAAMS